MSTFGGKLYDKRFNKICIDNFLPHNYDCSAFFLTHFHSDHMRGIYDSSFHSLFERKSTVFYCHELTRKFILACNEIKIPPYRIKTLDPDGTDVQLYEDVSIKVAWLSAGHCPGSIMLLFEGFGERVLYTGDIRLTLDDLGKLDALHSEGEPVPLDAMYLDTTFASNNYKNFPTRRESLASIKSHIEDWFAKDEQNRVCILSPANIGLEFLMVELCNAYSKKVHVSSESFERFLSYIPHLENVISTEIKNALIHFCSFGRCETCFRSAYRNDTLLLIKPSALFFTQPVLEKHGPVMFDHRTKLLRVCYSSHSSCDELVEFVRYLKPKKIYPCVVPPYTSEKEPNQFFVDFLSLCSRKDLACLKMEMPSSSRDVCTTMEIEDELSNLSQPELFIQAISNYLFRPIEPVPEPDVSDLIKRLGLETPT